MSHRSRSMGTLGPPILQLVAALASGLVLAAPVPVRAIDVLFVSDSSTADPNIAEALRADGHTVTVVSDDFATGNVALRGDLGRHGLVVWVASGSAYGDVHSDPAVFSALEAYVRSGGRVLVTGYDSIASPLDPLLIAFLGGTGSQDVPPPPGAISAEANSLTTGIVDIRGLTPLGAASDRDALTGVLPGTVIVCPSSSDPTHGQWTLRALDRGEIAWVSNGDSGGAQASWLVRDGGPTGAFNAALRNFAASASRVVVEAPPDPVPQDDVPSPLQGDRTPEIAVHAPPSTRLEFNADERSGLGWVASVHAAVGHTTEQQRAFAGGSVALGIRLSFDIEGADERRHGALNGLLGDSFGLDARGHLLGRLDPGADAAYAVAVGGALVAVNALRGGDVRIPSLVGLMLPEVGAIFREDLDPSLYVAFHAPFALLLEPWLSMELRASLFLVEGWRGGEGQEMLLVASIGVAVR